MVIVVADTAYDLRRSSSGILCNQHHFKGSKYGIFSTQFLEDFRGSCSSGSSYRPYLMHRIKPWEASFQLTEKETPANVQDNKGLFCSLSQNSKHYQLAIPLEQTYLCHMNLILCWIPSLSLHHVQCTTTHLVPGTFGQRQRYGIGGVDKNVDLKRWRCWHESIRGPGPNPQIVPGFQMIYLDEIPVAMDQTYNRG